MLIDPSTQIGQLRLALGDWRDLPVLNDDIYQSALDKYNNNFKAARTLCGQYILATLSFDSDAKMGIITSYGSQVYNQYKDYLLLVLRDPAFNGVCPLPYVAGADEVHPILQFKEDFTNAQNRPTSDERLHQIAVGPFDPYSGPVANGGVEPQ